VKIFIFSTSQRRHSIVIIVTYKPIVIVIVFWNLAKVDKNFLNLKQHQIGGDLQLMQELGRSLDNDVSKNTILILILYSVTPNLVMLLFLTIFNIYILY